MTTRFELSFALALLAACGGDLFIPASETLPRGDTGLATAFDTASDYGTLDLGNLVPAYIGAVVATHFADPTGAGDGSFSGYAAFAANQPESLGGCTSSGVGELKLYWPPPPTGNCCTCSTEQGISTPDIVPAVDASTVTLSSAAGATLGSYAPTSNQAMQGAPDTYDWWAGSLPSSYGGSASLAWTDGDALTVTAVGDQVDAFTGTLQTAVAFADVSPSFATGSLTIDRSQTFYVTWTPDGSTNDAVLLLFNQQSSPGGGFSQVTCYCAVDDSAGSVDVSVSELSQFSLPSDADSVKGSITLERLRFSSATSANAVIDLVGAVEQSASVSFQ